MSQEGQTYYTNDRNFKPPTTNLNIKYSPVIKIDPSTLVHDEPPAAAAVNSNELPQEVIDSMSSEQYQKYLEEKNDTSLSKKIVNVFSKIGGGIVSTFSDTRTENGRSRSRNLTAQVILDQKEFLTLNELSCASIREALENYKKNKKYLFKCTDITAENMRQEGITIADLKHYQISLMEIKKKFNISWSDVVNVLHLKPCDLTREDNWFDTTTLSEYVLDRTSLIDDIGFNIDDIRRLKCADLEISKLGITFDDLCRIGFKKQDLLAFPWFPDSMVSMLGLKAKHLSKSYLDLKKDDFDYLIRQRKGWTVDFFINHLNMKRELVDSIFSHVEQKRIKEQLMFSKKNHLDQLRDADLQQTYYTNGYSSNSSDKVSLRTLFEKTKNTDEDIGDGDDDDDNDNNSQSSSDDMNFSSTSQNSVNDDRNNPLSIALQLQKNILDQQFKKKNAPVRSSGGAGGEATKKTTTLNNNNNNNNNNTSKQFKKLKNENVNEKNIGVNNNSTNNNFTNNNNNTNNITNNNKNDVNNGKMNQQYNSSSSRMKEQKNKSQIIIGGKKYVEQNDDEHEEIEFINSYEQFADKASNNEKSDSTVSFTVM